MKEWLMEFANTPMGTALAIAIGIIVETIIVMNKTSFGKKMLNNLKDRIFTHEEKVGNEENGTGLFGKCKKLNDETKERADKLEKDYQAELKMRDEKIAELEDFITNTLRCINNVNVKKAVENYEKNKCEQFINENEKNSQNGENE